MFRGIHGVGDTDALIGDEIKKLVFLDGTAQSGAELVSIQERHLWVMSERCRKTVRHSWRCFGTSRRLRRAARWCPTS